MKNIILVAIATLALVGCSEGDVTNNTNNYNYGTIVGDGAYYVEVNGDGDVISCTTTVQDSNGTTSTQTCSSTEIADAQELVDTTN